MKSRVLRQAGALLLALSLVCSLLTLPVAAKTVTDDSKLFQKPQTLRMTVGDSPRTVNFQPVNNSGFIWSGESISWVNDSPGIIEVDGSPDQLQADVTPLAKGEAEFSLKITLQNDYPDLDLAVGDEILVPCQVIVSSQVTNILINPTMNMTVGETASISARIEPSDAQASVSWTSSDTSVVSVSNGSVTALKEGVAVITVSAGSVSKDCRITVSEPVATGITLDPESASVSSGGSFTITAGIIPGTVLNKNIDWQCSNPKVIVKAAGGGTYTVSVPASVPEGTIFNLIAVSSANPSISKVCTVRVSAPQSPPVTGVVIVSPQTDNYKYVDPGKSFQLSAEVSPADASEEDKTILWTSSDTSVATVEQDGTIKGVSPGKATITAQAGGPDGPAANREIEVSGILLSYIKKSSTGGTGETVDLTEDSVVDIFQYRDISVTPTTYGQAKLKLINWESTNNSVAQVISGRVSANYPGENAIISASVAGTGYRASFKVRVLEDVAQAIDVDMGTRPSYSFSNLTGTLNSRSQSKAGAPLDNVYNLKVSTKNGVLYYGYSSPDSPGHGVGGTERYYYQPSAQGQLSLRDVTFVPLPGFSGTAVVDYNAVATNGSTFTGTIRIEATTTGDVSYSTAANQPVSFSAEHFSAVCKARNGQGIRYITFDPPSSSRGTLYYNYSPAGQFSPKVDSSTRYYASSNPSIDNITFVPAEGFTGDLDITYRCTDSSGATYTGTVTITVYSSSGSQDKDVEYSTGLNQRQDLNASDFNDVCRQATGGSLDFISFDDLPASRTGTLHLNYTSNSSTRVIADREYYRNSTPRISSISFVPARDYSGTVSIPFTGTNTSGTTFSGNLVIHVDEDQGTIHYESPKNQPVDFSASDFNDACRRINDATLNYVRFTSLPSSSAGTLYYGYSSSSSPGSRASTSTDYHRSGSPSLSSLTFVPADGYSGTVTIPFTGYDNDAARFNGDVTITIGSGSSRTISYSVATGRSVRFDAADFNSACRSATGDALDYIHLDLPASRYGTLYYQYNTSSRTGGSVNSNTSYYRTGSRLISDVSFAAASTAGTASFGYTGYSSQGDSFSGTVEIRITSLDPASTTIRYTGSSTPVSFRSSSFQSACQAGLENPLSYVQFNALPITGHLYLNYSGPSRTGTAVSSGVRYGLQELNQISYLPKAEHQGIIAIPYTAYDTQGGSCSGTVEIQLSSAYCYTSFGDVASGWDWAKPSIEFLRQSGIASGYRDGTFRPGQPISRGEFTLMICRAFQFSTVGNSSSFPDVPANSSYAGAVATARDLGIVQGNNGLFQPNQPITRQSAMTMICRAIQAAGQSLPAANSSILSSYADGGQVSNYARSSVAALIQMGAVGGTNMRINPTATISRAQMAVILHRVLTR